MSDPFGYPAPRERGAGVMPARLPLFQSHETTQGFVALTDADADVIRFSGWVSRVEISAELFDAVVKLTDRNNAESSEITVRVNTSITIDYRCTIVRARNGTPGSNARIQVLGFFELPGPRVIKAGEHVAS